MEKKDKADNRSLHLTIAVSTTTIKIWFSLLILLLISIKDFAYDISDTDSIFGTMADSDELFQKGHEKRDQNYFKNFIPNQKVQSYIQYKEHFIQANFI